MFKERCSGLKIVAYDINGCFAIKNGVSPWDRELLVHLAADGKFLKHTSQVIRSYDGQPETFALKMKQALSICYEQKARPDIPEQQMPEELRHWEVLTKDQIGLPANSAWDKIHKLSNGLEVPDGRNLVEGYVASPVAIGGLWYASRMGALITFITGIPYDKREELYPIVAPVVEVLNKDLSVIMNVNPQVVSGIHIKLAALGLLGKYRPDGAIRKRTYNDVFFVDDDRLVNIASIDYLKLNKAYSPLSYSEALRQPHVDNYFIPKNNLGTVINDPQMSELMSDLSNPQFHNHPKPERHFPFMPIGYYPKAEVKVS